MFSRTNAPSSTTTIALKSLRTGWRSKKTLLKSDTKVSIFEDLTVNPDGRQARGMLREGFLQVQLAAREDCDWLGSMVVAVIIPLRLT